MEILHAYLIHALNHGYRGYWIDFKDLLDLLWQAIGDHTDKKLIRRFADIGCLVFDELGHAPIRKEQAGLFFDLMKRRHKKKTTLITTQLGYDEWPDFLQNKHLAAALLDRVTENCTVFNMRKCISIRPKTSATPPKTSRPPSRNLSLRCYCASIRVHARVKSRCPFR